MKPDSVKSPQGWPGFVKPYRVFGVVFAILALVVAYLMVRVYQSSSLLAEASRKSFSQEARTRAANLDGYFERLRSDVETLSKSKALHAYYQNKALGMSMEYGLSVSVAEIRDEFERFQKTVQSRNLPIFEHITLLDSRDMRVITQTNPTSENAANLDGIKKSISGSTRFPLFTAFLNHAEWEAFVVMRVIYKGEVNGYLMMKLDLATLRSQIEVGDSPELKEFYIIAEASGVIFVGPKQFLGNTVAETLGFSLQSMVGFVAQEVAGANLRGVGRRLIVAGGQIPGVPFYVIRVAPSEDYLAGYATHLWVMVFAGLLTCLMIMLTLIFRSLKEQSKIYGALQEAKANLELRVQTRTSELAQTNIMLQEEIKVRTGIEESLRQSEERYRDLFEHASDLIFTRDMNGRFSSVNGVVTSVLGYSPEEFLEMGFNSMVDPDFRDIVERKIQIMLEDDTAYTGPYEVIALSSEGNPVWLEVTSRIMKKDGVSQGIHCIARNVTERKQLEDAVLEAQMKYQAVVEAFEGLIHISSTEHLIQFANQRLIDRTGYNPVGQKCHKVVHGLNEICPWCNNEKFASMENYRSEILSPYDDRWYNIVSTPMLQQDGKSSRIFLMHDIDDRKRTQQERERLEQQLAQSQKMEAVGTLAGGIAHDFNNMLQVVLGYSRLLLEGQSLGQKDHKNVEKIHSAARQGADLVKGLLAFSRNALTITGPINLNHQIEEIIELLDRTIPKMIKIELKLEESLPIINADSGQIKQVLMNLALNARDAMPDGGVLTIETRSEFLDPEFCKDHLDSVPGYYCMLGVTDTGHGMDGETLDHMFEPFYTTKEVGKGTGLGLAMVFGMVRQHDGFIACESDLGKGTRLNIYFPAMRGFDQLTHVEQEESQALAVGSGTLLLVDDEDLVRDLGADYLREIGYSVITANNGKHALEVYKANQYEIDVVLLDLIMPEMDGRKCLGEILRIDPQAKVILVSGYSAGGPAEEWIKCGAKGFVNKPYDLANLVNTVRSVLNSDTIL